MVEYVCDSKKHEKALCHLVDKVRQYGGIVHEKLILGSRKGNLVVRAPGKINAGEPIIILPREILLPVKKYDLDLKDDKFVIKGHDDSLNKGQVEIMEAMLDVYNLTDKIKGLRAASTVLNWREGDPLFEHLKEGRGPMTMSFLDELDKRGDNQYVINKFWKTRVLGFIEKAPAQEKKDGKKSKAQKGAEEKTHTQMLMPITDFINHHGGATGFITNFKMLGGHDMDKVAREEGGADHDGVAVVKSCPIEGSDECYVSYGPYDALDTFLNYDFVERYASITRSVPVTVKLPGLGTLRIAGLIGRPDRQQLPDMIKDLSFYMPQIGVDKQKNLIFLGFIYIPQHKAPRSMRRVLNAALNAYAGSDLTEDDRMEYILRAEKQIIDANIAFYTGLEDILKSYKPAKGLEIVAQNARDVAQVQLQWIRSYPFFEDVQNSPYGIPAEKIKPARKSSRKAAKKGAQKTGKTVKKAVKKAAQKTAGGK